MSRGRLLACCGMLLALVGACTRTTDGTGLAVVDGAWIADSIEESDQAKAIGIRDVVCPDSEPLKVGETFNCKAGQTVIEVKITSLGLEFNWAIKPAG